MLRNKHKIILLVLFSVIFARNEKIVPFLVPFVFAHCDTLDGPVIKDARIALEKKDAIPVLKWVKEEKETEIKAAFEKALAERSEGSENKEKADMEFFEALVRIHREGEGASFEGLKPAGSELEPAVEEADKSLEHGSADELIKLINEDMALGIRKRFGAALEKKKHKDESIEAGREFVEAYVEFVHYVEKLHLDVVGESAHHHAELEELEHKTQHKH